MAAAMLERFNEAAAVKPRKVMGAPYATAARVLQRGRGGEAAEGRISQIVKEYDHLASTRPRR